jgi:EKC/KEOPS complex subunit CGI121/TPRKB
METIDLPHLQPELRLHLAFFADVKNAVFLRKQLLEGNTDFEYAFLDCSQLLSRNHILAACFRAVNDSLAGRLKTRNVHSEIVFALSPNNNVRVPVEDMHVVQTCIIAHTLYLDCRILPPIWHFR